MTGPHEPSPDDASSSTSPRGRPRAPLSPDITPQVSLFAEELRIGIFGPLKARGVSLRALSEHLGKTLGEGYSISTLQRVQAGTRVPTREILDGILHAAGQLAGQPLRPEPRQHLYSLYYAALRITDQGLHNFYLLLEERDAYAQLCAQLRDVESDLMRQRAEAMRHEASVQDELDRAQEAERRLTMALAAADAERQISMDEVREQFTEAQAEIARLTAEQNRLAAEQETLREQASQSAELKTDLRARDEELARLRTEVARKLSEVRAESARAVRAAEEQRDQAQTQLADQRARTQSDVARAEARCAELGRQVEEHAAQADELRAQLQAAQRGLAASERRLVALYQERDQLARVQTQRQSDDQAVAEAETVVVNALDAMRGEIASLQLPAPVSAQAEGVVSGTETMTNRSVKAGSAPLLDTDAAEGAARAVPPRGRRHASQVRKTAGALLCVAALAGGLIIWAPWNTSRSPSTAQPSHSNTATSTSPSGLWSFPTGEIIIDSAAVADGVVYFGSYDSKVYAVDAVSGTQQWSYTTKEPIYCGATAKDGTVYIGSTDGYLYALNAATGAKRWAYHAGGQVHNRPVVTHGKLYFANDTTAFALQASTGRLLWSRSLGEYVQTDPAVVGDTMYIGRHETMYALSTASGTVRWTFSVDGNSFSSPTVTGDTLYTTSYDHKVYAVNTADGTQRWAYTAGGQMAGQAAVAEGTVYAGGNDGKVYALRATDGKKRWIVSVGDLVLSDTVERGGLVYVGTEDGHLYALDAASGVKKWNYLMGGGIQAGATLAGGHLYVGSRDGRMHALDAATGRSAPIDSQASTGSTPSPTVTASDDGFFGGPDGR